MKTLTLCLLLFFSLNTNASDIVRCEFRNSNVSDDTFIVEHNKTVNSHEITEFENDLIKGFISYLKGYLIIHINLLEANQIFNFRSYIDEGRVFSTDLSTPELGYWILLECK